MGPGLAPKPPGTLRFSLDITRGLDFEASHREDTGLSSSGAIVSTPAHRHLVSLDFTRFELGVQYSFADNWDLWTRLPFDTKKRSASLELIDPASAAEQMDMQRNLDLHHRDDETLEGLSDIHLLVAHRTTGWFAADDVAWFAFGTSLPTGKTEGNPFVAGAAGLPHEHVQFGTGSFDPLLEAYYGYALTPDFRLSTFGLGRFPLYENSKGYQGPIEATVGVAVNHHTTNWLTLRASLGGFYQGYAHWDGVRDVNSGLVSTSWTLGGEFDMGGGLHTNLLLRFPISQHTLTSAGDTFEEGPVLLFTTSYTFGQPR